MVSGVKDAFTKLSSFNDGHPILLQNQVRLFVGARMSLPHLRKQYSNIQILFAQMIFFKELNSMNPQESFT